MASIFISAAHKSSGKTTVSIGLCAALSARQHIIQPFKKGPDYIDPLWLSRAAGRPCHNLDFNTMTHAEIKAVVSRYGADAALNLIEANKGLYDGVSADGCDSNAALAALLGTPVMLVIDTRGITRGIAPLLLGYQAFGPELQLAGVILNRVGGSRHAGKLQRAVEQYTDMTVLGAVQENAEMAIEERHLGLMPSNESRIADQQIARIAALVADQVNLPGVLTLAGADTQPPRQAIATELTASAAASGVSSASTADTKLRIAICQDAAFAFYYPGDLEALQQAGAELVPVNTLKDTALPTAIDGLFIGGGFPETCLHELAANHSLRQSIHAAIEAGLPTYAECGGLMYLARSLSWQGERAEMVGIIPGDAVMHPKPQGRGYVRLAETAQMPWPDGDRHSDQPREITVINAHEFHYSALENLTEPGQFAYRVLRGTGIDGQHDGWVYKNLLASYSHMRHTAQFPWAQRFVAFIRTVKEQTNDYCDA